jgi:hypothetical protein
MKSEHCASGRPSVRQFGGEPFYQRGVDFNGPLLRHPMAGGHDDFAEVGAVAMHRFGEPGVDRFTGIVVGAVQKEDGESEFASVLCLGTVRRTSSDNRRSTRVFVQRPGCPITEPINYPLDEHRLALIHLNVDHRPCVPRTSTSSLVKYAAGARPRTAAALEQPRRRE